MALGNLLGHSHGRRRIFRSIHAPFNTALLAAPMYAPIEQTLGSFGLNLYIEKVELSLHDLYSLSAD